MIDLSATIRNAGFTIAVMCLAALMPTGPAYAEASLEISPTRIVLTERAPVTGVNIRNRGDEKVVVQLQLLSWSQDNGEEHYSLANDAGLAICPSVITLQPGEVQIVRIGLESPDIDWSEERPYRLIIQEVPPPPVNTGRNVQIAVRISVPVFLQPAVMVQPTLKWDLEKRDGNGLWMTVRNDGNAHALIGGVRLEDSDQFAYDVSTHKYVLPGATISWRLDKNQPLDGALPKRVNATISTDQGVYQETLKIKK